MSEAWTYAEHPAVGVESASSENRASRSTRFMRRLVALLGVVLVLECIWFCVVIPFLPFSHIELEYNGELSREALLQAAGITSSSSFFLFNVASAQEQLLAIPSVASAKVWRRFPDRLHIQLEQRQAVAWALAEIDGRMVPLSFDSEGVVFRLGLPQRVQDADLLSSLPVVSGLVFEHPGAGVQLPVFLKSFLQDLRKLGIEQPDLLRTVSEIRIQKKAYDTFDLVIYPVSRDVRFRTGPRLNEEMLRYMMLVLDVLASRGVQTDEIDFRAGTAVYNEKEASSG